MKSRSLKLVVIATALLGGCDREGEKTVAPDNRAAPEKSVDAGATPKTAPSLPALSDADAAIVQSAGRRINETKDAIDSAKLDEAEARLKELERLKDYLSTEQQAQLRSYRIVLGAGQKMTEKLKPQTVPVPK